MSHFSYLGVEQVHKKFDDKDHITMASHNKYKKNLVKESPKKVDTWHSDAPSSKTKVKKFERGLRRWKKLPEAIDVSMKPRADQLFLSNDISNTHVWMIQ
jgi:hypothetical protein